MPSSYHVGLSLPENASTYVVRSADEELLTELQNGKFCCVLGARQTGKSSLLVKTIHDLRAINYECVHLYFRSENNSNEDNWYWNIANQLRNNLSCLSDLNIEDWWNEHNSLSPFKKIEIFFQELVLEQRQSRNYLIAILIDEVDSIQELNFSIEKFWKLIEFYTSQQNSKICFAIFGVLKPDSLKTDHLKNFCQIFLTNFQQGNLIPLQSGLSGKGDRRKILAEIFKWTGGQPLLTQKICQIVQDLWLFVTLYAKSTDKMPR